MEMVANLNSPIQVEPETMKAIRRFLLALEGRYDVAGAILYGSRARGDHAPDSDTDVAVLLHGERGSIHKTVLGLSDIAYDVMLDTGVHISALPVWVDDFEHPEKAPNPFLMRNIAREGIRL